MCRTVVFLLLAWFSLAGRPLSADEPLTVEQLRNSVNANGRVTDIQLRQHTGWELIRGFSWRIELEDSQTPGLFSPANPGQTFQTGQRFRIQMEAFCDVYAYVLVRNADGSRDVLLPEHDEQVPRIGRGRTLLLPPDGTAFRFQPPGGTHQLRLIASPLALPWVDAHHLLKLRNGQELTTREEETLAQLKHVKGLKAAIDKIGQGALTRGCQVVLLEPGVDGNLVTLTSADPTATPILVHDVFLKQTE